MKVSIEVLTPGTIPIYDILSKAKCIGDGDFTESRQRITVPLCDPTPDFLRSLADILETDKGYETCLIIIQEDKIGALIKGPD